MLNILLMIILLIIILIFIFLLLGIRLTVKWLKINDEYDGCVKILILKKLTIYTYNIKSEDSEERLAVAMRLDWEESRCTVTVELVPAALTVRPQESSTIPGFAQTLTFSSAVDKMKSLHPSVLELEGESMEDYRVYSKDGLVLINDQSCMRLDVYKLDEELGTNMAAGNYFLSADGLHLYSFDEKTETVRELPMGTA